MGVGGKLRPRRPDKIDKVLAFTNHIIRLLLAVSVPAGIMTGQWLVVLAGCGILALIYAVELFERHHRIFFTLELKTFYALLLFLSLFLGGALDFYSRYHWWDRPIHFLSGLGLGVLGFLFLQAYYRRGKLNLPLLVITLLNFCFAVTIGMVWEIYEFASDELFGTAMQPDNRDTMIDIIANSAGALVSAAAGHRYLGGRKLKILSRITNKFMNQNVDLAT